MTTETPDERRERQLEQFDHTHLVAGAPIPLGQTQDAAGDHCPDCGRSVYTGHVDPHMNTQPFNHAIGCVNYQPHPASIEASKN